MVATESLSPMPPSMRGLCDAVIAFDPAHRRLPTVALDHELRIGERRHLRQMGDDEDLASGGESGEQPPPSPARSIHSIPASISSKVTTRRRLRLPQPEWRGRVCSTPPPEATRGYRGGSEAAVGGEEEPNPIRSVGTGRSGIDFHRANGFTRNPRWRRCSKESSASCLPPIRRATARVSPAALADRLRRCPHGLGARASRSRLAALSAVSAPKAITCRWWRRTCASEPRELRRVSPAAASADGSWSIESVAWRRSRPRPSRSVSTV